MGSGKTFRGRSWAEKSELDFYDIDEMVEFNENKPIASIFAEDGEDHFRNLETIELRNLLNKNNFIAATGGGTPCFNDNISWMNENGITVYLRSSPQNILKRLVNEKEKRPLVKNLQDEELLFYITEKIKEREAYYNRAKFILDVDELPGDYFPEFLNV